MRVGIHEGIEGKVQRGSSATVHYTTLERMGGSAGRSILRSSLRGRPQQQADWIEAQRNVGTSGEPMSGPPHVACCHVVCCMLQVARRVLRVLCACVWTTFERSKLFADPPPRLTRLRTNNVQRGTWHTKYNMAHGIQHTTWHIFPMQNWQHCAAFHAALHYVATTQRAHGVDSVCARK